LRYKDVPSLIDIVVAATVFANAVLTWIEIGSWVIRLWDRFHDRK
jgi:hypothetical protein